MSTALSTTSRPLIRHKSRPPPISNAESRELLQKYKLEASNSNRERQRTSLSTAVSNKKQSANVAQIVLGQYEKAMTDRRYDEAINCLLEAIRLGEGRHDVYFNVAALLQHKNAFQEANDFFTRAIHSDPLHAEDYLRRSECHASLNQPLEAFGELEKYFKLEQPTKALLVKCGKYALDADLLDESASYLLRALDESAADEEAPTNDAYACFNLGELHERQGDDVKATEYYERVCVLDPAFPAPYLTQAHAEVEQKNFTMALHLYEAVAKITPTVPSVYLRLADVYESLGEEFAGSVLSSLTRAADLTTADDPVHESTLVRRGILRYTVFEALDDAATDFTMCIEHNGECAQARLHRATVLRRRNAPGDALQAVDDYRVAITLDISWDAKAEPMRYLATYELEHGDATLAATFFALSRLWKPFSDVDQLNAVASYAAGAAAAGSASTLHPPIYDVACEPRHYVTAKDDKARKAMEATLAQRGPPVPSYTYTAIDATYTNLRSREPTVHSAEEYRVVEAWRAYREEVERVRDDEALRAKKGGKRK